VTSGLFHIGILVDDLRSAMTYFTDVMGVRWRPVYDVPLTLTGGPDGEVSIVLRLVYSTGPAPVLELIERAPGTPFADVPGGGHVHHLGIWSQDLPGDVDRLTGLSPAPLGPTDLRATVAADSGRPSCLALLTTPFGVHLELVDPEFARPGLPDLVPPF
jgi:hypothetical protein